MKWKNQIPRYSRGQYEWEQDCIRRQREEKEQGEKKGYYKSELNVVKKLTKMKNSVSRIDNEKIFLVLLILIFLLN